MRFIFLTILVVILVVFLNAIAPFWMVMIGIGVLAALINPSGVGGFLGGGLGMGLTWLGQCVYLEITTSSPLPDRMGEIMGLGSGVTLIAVTAVVGFVLGGFSGWTGVLFRNMTQRSPDDVYRG